MMKHQNLRRNLILSAGLLAVYTATFLIAMAVGRPVETLNFIATAGVAAGAALILSWLPFSYYAAIVLFACAAQYFGMMFDFYHMFWWYDIVIHFLSGILLGAMGHFLCRLLCKKMQAVLPIAVSVLFAVFFAAACAGLWEIYTNIAPMSFSVWRHKAAARRAQSTTPCRILSPERSAPPYMDAVLLCSSEKSDPAKSFICLAAQAWQGLF